jgi:NADH dehydrogenase
MTIKTVAVTGSTGFVGRHVVRELLAHGYGIRALARSEDAARRVLPRDSRVSLVLGDALNAATLDELCRGCTAAIHLVGIIREERGGLTFQQAHVGAPRALLAACERAGVKRFLAMSALGVSPTGRAEYQTTKFEGEQLVRASTTDWTIFRPGMILGEGSKFLAMAIDWAKGEAQPWLFMPYFTRGIEDTSVPLGPMHTIVPQVQPIDVKDVAKAFISSIPNPTTFGETYNLVGPDRISWPDMLAWIRDTHVHGSTMGTWGVPSELAALQAQAFALTGMKHVLPFDAGMAIMGGQDSVGELTKVREHLGLTPRKMMG